ncbi:hypothetical protein C8F01DRAFT_1143168 [Mycena amicta]|nr:hypothetical protein C8F01DRAFT_1143168 [Mycena amicta]
MEMYSVPILRNESASSASSAESDDLDHVLKTPADEHTLNFDLIDGALLAATPPKALIDFGYRGRSPHRISLSRQFSKAIDEANKSTEGMVTSQILPRMGPEIRVYPDSPRVPNSSPEMYCTSTIMEPVQLAAPEPPQCPVTPQEDRPEIGPSQPTTPEARPKTPELRPSDIYTTGNAQNIVKTPRGRPGIRRSDIFSPAPPPVPFALEEESVEFTPRAHSTLRHRRGTVLRPSESIEFEVDMVGDVTLEPQVQHEASELVLDTDDYLALDFDFPRPSVILPLQLIAFPIYASLVGAVILLAPDHLTTVAFPATITSASVSHSSASALLHAVLALIFPFSAPSAPKQPVREFAHWVSVAHLHVAIFLAFLAGVTYLNLPAGVLLAAVCVARVVQPSAWGSFSLPDGDEEEEELGGDVREMLWRAVVVAPGSGLRDGEGLKKVGARYFVVPKMETRADVLRAGGLDDEEGGDE